MSHVVTYACFGCKHKRCITACPVDSFHEGEQMLYINPDVCIDCEQCVPECPEGAIFQEDDVPAEWEGFIDLNAEMSAKTPNIFAS